MNIKNIKEKVIELACKNFNQMCVNDDINLFDYNIDAYELLYFAMDIEKYYKVSLEKIFDKTNYKFLTINNITEKIYDQMKE